MKPDRRKHIIFLLPGCFGLLFLFLFSNKNGLGFTHDSFYYLAEATKADHLFGIQRLLVFVLDMVDSDLLIIKYLFLVGYVAAFFLLSTLGLRVLNFNQSLLFSWLVATSTPFLMVNSFLWTESFFIVGVAGLLMVLSYHSAASKPGYYVRLIMVLAFCLWSRKAGMIFALGYLLNFIISHPKWRLSGKIAIGVVLVAVLVWLYGYGCGPNYIGERPVFSNIPSRLLMYLDGMSLWLLPRPVTPLLRIPIALLTMLFLLVFSLRAWKILDFFWKTIFFLLFFYCALRLFYLRDIASEVERYLAPVQPLYFLALIKSVSSTLHERYLRSKWALLMIVIWLGYPCLRVLKNARLWHGRDRQEVNVKDHGALNDHDASSLTPPSS